MSDKMTAEQQVRLACLDYATRGAIKLGSQPGTGALKLADSFYEWVQQKSAAPKKRGRPAGKKGSDGDLEALGLDAA